MFENSIETAKPNNSLSKFFEECTATAKGVRISEMHTYLSYVAWYVNIYEDGPSATYGKFIAWLQKSGIPYSKGQDDIRWISDRTLTKTFLHFMSDEEREALADILRQS